MEQNARRPTLRGLGSRGLASTAFFGRKALSEQLKARAKELEARAKELKARAKVLEARARMLEARASILEQERQKAALETERIQLLKERVGVLCPPPQGGWRLLIWRLLKKINLLATLDDIAKSLATSSKQRLQGPNWMPKEEWRPNPFGGRTPSSIFGHPSKEE